MIVSDEPGRDEQQQELVRYLLGMLPDDEAERLDEESIADKDLALRLEAVEHDLIDAYVSGTLGGETLGRFEACYLTSPLRREKVSVARGLRRILGESREGAAVIGGAAVTGVPAVDARRRVPASRLAWAMAIAAVLLLAACGALLFTVLRVQREQAAAQESRVALERRVRELEQQLDDQRSARAAAPPPTVSVPSASTPTVSAPHERGPASPALVGLVLLPPTRDGGPPTTLTIPAGTDRVTFELRLEVNEFPQYRVALIDRATGRTLWQSDALIARRGAVSVSIPASLFNAHGYALDLTGRRTDGDAEVIGSYSFATVLR